MPPITEALSILVLAFGAILGMGALINPKWAAGVVRLAADPDPAKPGGFSEFRATYGGLLLFLHLTALAIMLQPELALPFKLFATLPLAMAWIGAGVGRFTSLLLDTEENRARGLIPVWIPMELTMGLAIASPVLQLL